MHKKIGWLTLPVLFVAFLLGPANLYASDLNKVYSVEGRGVSYTAAGNSVRTDNRAGAQSEISIVALPGRAKVVKAFLYWNGEVLAVSSADTSVDLILPSGKVCKIHAEDVRSNFDGGLAYSCRADVTERVRSNGVYRIKELDLDPIRGKRGVSGNWSIVLVYKAPGLASKSKVTIYDNLSEGDSAIEQGNIQTKIDSAWIIEQRPRDVLFFLKMGDERFSSGNYFKSFGNYSAALWKAPVFAFSYILQVRINRIAVAIEKGLHRLRPFLVSLNSALAVFFIAYAVLLNLVYLALTLIAFHVAKRYFGENRGVSCADFARRHKVTPVSILISAYNEEHAIGRTLASLLKLNYPEYEVIVINDGSQDRTLDVLKQEYELREYEAAISHVLPACESANVYQSARFPNLYVIDKKNSGKADSLNAGLNLSRFPLFCTIDADTILEEEALSQLVLPVLENPDEVVGTTGMVRLRNGCTSFLAVMQVLEYIRAYSIGRIGWNLFNSHVIVSGAFSLYRKDLVVRLGGYHRYAIGEDVELNMRIHKALLEAKQKYKIVYVFAAQCLTHAPVDLKSLARQRGRWQQGLMTTVRLNTRILFNPQYGSVGMLAMPFYALLELPAPILEFFGYIVMPLFALFHMLSVKYMLVLLGLVLMYGAGLSFAAILLDRKYFKFYNEESYRKLCFFLLFESLGFHQLTVFWRMRGTVDYLKEVHVREIGWRSPDRLKIAEYA